MKNRTSTALAIATVLGLAAGGLAVAERGVKNSSNAMDRAATLDANENGFIEQGELDAERLTLFAEIDANGDGGLSMEELDAHRAAKRAERKARRFARQDANGDGLIGPEEFQSRRSKRFSHMDLDGDGAISLEHWASQKRGDHRHGRRHKRGRH